MSGRSSLRAVLLPRAERRPTRLPGSTSIDTTALAARLLEPIPANAAFGIRVESATDGRATVALDEQPALANVIGSLHASGLMALVDAAGLAAMIALAENPGEFERVTPLGRDASLSFIAPATGPLRGRCELARRDRAILRLFLSGSAERGRLTTEVEVVDRTAAVVCRGVMSWSLRRR